MAGYRTREERKKILHEHYYGRREKLFIMALFAVIFIVLVSALILAVQTRAHIMLIVLLSILIFITIPIAAFMIDSVSYEME
jgi:multisubunit Na+/H+ antiporter MnhG subunit